MKPIKLTLSGFKGIRAGLGLEEVTIDFTNMPNGLIAVVGGNGSGKTTILDNLHPYRIMPYKLRDSKSGWTPDAFSYYGQCFGREARKLLIFQIGQSFFKSELLIDAERRKMEAYLSSGASADGPWTPINDGKNSTYDHDIESVVGSPNLFFTSAFQSQGAKNLSSYTRGDIMSIIGELLDLGHIREQGDKARKVADALTTDSAMVQSKIDDIITALESQESESDLLLAVESDITMTESYIGTLKETLNVERERLTTLEKRNADLANQQEKIDAAAANLKTAEEHLYNLRNDLDKVGRERTIAGEKYRDELDRILKGKDRLQKIIDNGDVVRAKDVERKEVEQSLTDLREQEIKLRAEAEELGVVKSQSEQAKTNLYNYQKDLKDKRERVAVLGDLDCKGDSSGWVNESCPLLENAVKAKELIAVIEKDIAAFEKDIDDAAPKIERYEQIAVELGGVRTEINEKEKSLKEIVVYSCLLPELESAETSMKDIDERELRQRDSCRDQEAEFDKRISGPDGLKGRVDQQLVVVDKAKEKHETEKSAIDGNFQNQMTEITGKINRAESELTNKETYLKDQLIKVGRLKEALANIDNQKAEKVELVNTLSRYNDTIADWALLAKACSNDAIIALEIDDAGPTISALANDLLNACYGTRFSIRFETQGEKTDGSAKEVFDITVFDSERNEEKSIKDMSGGEVTWIEDALRRAICLVNIQKTDRVYETMFSDEKDGALDASRKGEFFSIKRRAMELGSHNNEIFISQTPDLQDQAEGRILLKQGGIEVTW